MPDHAPTSTTPAGSPPAMLKTRLSIMMFLQYAIWGAWLPILYPFLKGHREFDNDEIAMIFAAGAVGAILGPAVAGQIADRYFSTEKFLALSHMLGAVLVYFLAKVDGYYAFVLISLLYGIVYAPTIALTNSLSFHHLEDRDRDFGPVRLWGTLGWIAAGIAMGHWLATKHSPTGLSGHVLSAAQNAGRSDAFMLSAILGSLMSVFCLTLPSTPPSKTAREKSAVGKALRAIRFQPLLTLFILAVPISIIHQFYFVHTSDFLTELQNARPEAKGFAEAINTILGVGGGGLMTVGQMAEIGVLATIPLLAKALTRKHLLAIGIVAYAARMALFAYMPDNYLAVLLGIALHGLCFGCFIFVAFMVVDEEVGSDIKASAQNLFNLVIVGIGTIVGSWFATSVVASWASYEKLDEAGAVVLDDNGKAILETDFTALFSVPMWMALGCLVVLLVFYPGKKPTDRLPA